MSLNDALKAKEFIPNMNSDPSQAYDYSMQQPGMYNLQGSNDDYQKQYMYGNQDY